MWRPVGAPRTRPSKRSPPASASAPTRWSSPTTPRPNAPRCAIACRTPPSSPLDDEPALHVTRLLADGWFDTPGLTGEDRARAAHYRRERERGELRESTGSHEEFLRELGVRVHLGPPEPHEHG
ncbi:hypothetical protein GCM10020000_52300 [Streptomyces olivoverticillatus]